MADSDLTRDGFLGGRLQLWQPRRGFRSASDAVLVAAAVPALPGESVLELGCGAGVAALCLASRTGASVTGLELQADYAALARRNAKGTGLPLEVIEGDVAAPPATLKSRRFDHVFLNPPYYPSGAGTDAEVADRATALREEVPLRAWIDAALRRVSPKGTVTVIAGADRVPALLAACDTRIGALHLRPLQPRAGRPAKRVILQGIAGSRAGFTLCAPFVLHAAATHLGDGDDHTEAAQAVLRDGEPLEVVPTSPKSLNSYAQG